MVQSTCRLSLWSFKYYFFFFHKILQNPLQKPFKFIFYFFYKITKMKIKSFECPKSIRNNEKKYLEHQTLGWPAACPIGPAYYIVDCRILSWNLIWNLKLHFWNWKKVVISELGHGCYVVTITCVFVLFIIKS